MAELTARHRRDCVVCFLNNNNGCKTRRRFLADLSSGFYVFHKLNFIKILADALNKKQFHNIVCKKHNIVVDFLRFTC